MSASRAAFRVALVGCGRISANHVEAIAKIDGLTLTAVCDTDATRARAAGERIGVPWYSDYATIRDPRGARGEARHQREADGDLARGGRCADARLR